MRLNTLLLMTFIITSTKAAADWVMVDENKYIQHYYDPATINNDGSISSVWILHNNKVRTKEGEYSVRYKGYFNCASKLWSLSDFETYSGQMATGERISYLDPNDKSAPLWRPISSSPSLNRLFDIVCNTRPQGDQIPK
jgi:hypothetical protein